MSATTQEEQKRAVGRAAVSYVQDGMVLGVGTGTTAAHFIAGLIEARPAVKAFVASSERSAAALRGAGLEVTDLDAAGPVGTEYRFPNECVRHKVLDLIGDLALLEYPVHAEIVAHRAGHALHVAAVNDLLTSLLRAAAQSAPFQVG